MTPPTANPSPPQARGGGGAMADLLNRPAFRTFWLANLISSLGTSAFVLAINWLTVKQHGAAGIAALALAYGLPQMLLLLVGGTVSDRINRRSLFGLTQVGLLLIAVLILIASLRGLVPLWLLALVSAVNGLLAAFDTPTRTALVTDLVQPEQVTRAQQLYSLTGSATNIFGPALGGVLLSLGPSARSHEEVAFAFNVISYVPLLMAIPWLPGSPGRSSRPEDTASAPTATPLETSAPTRESFQTSLRAGLHLVRHSSNLRTLLLLLSLVMVLGMPFQGLLPVFVQRHLSAETGHGFYAALMSAVGLGSFVGSLLGMGLVERWRAGVLLTFASAGLGGSVLLLSASNVVHWASLSAFLAGGFGTMAVSVDNALLQASTNREMQGRINAIANLTKGLQSLSLAAAGYTIHLLGLTGRFSSGYQVVQVSLAIGLLAGVAWLWPRLRRLNMAGSRSLGG